MVCELFLSELTLLFRVVLVSVFDPTRNVESTGHSRAEVDSRYDNN